MTCEHPEGYHYSRMGTLRRLREDLVDVSLEGGEIVAVIDWAANHVDWFDEIESAFERMKARVADGHMWRRYESRRGGPTDGRDLIVADGSGDLVLVHEDELGAEVSHAEASLIFLITSVSGDSLSNSAAARTLLEMLESGGTGDAATGASIGDLVGDSPKTTA